MTLYRNASVPSKISVVIPFFDEFAYLEACLGSVLAAGDAVEEVILINDQPTTENRQFLDTLDSVPKVRVLHNHANIGAFATRNVGITQAKGVYLLFLDADDMLSPAGLNDLLEFAEEAKADLVYLPTLRYDPKRGHTERFYRDRKLFGKRATSQTVRTNPELRYGVANWSVLLRKSFVDEASLSFDADQRRAADHLFILAAVEAATSIATFDQWIHIWRNRGGSITTKQAGLADFEMQLSTLRKNAQFMEQRYPIKSVDFQRDFAFVFLRFIWNWTFFESCIPIRESSTGAKELLSKLSQLLGDYPIDPKVFSDDILRRALPAKIWSTAGRLLSTEQIVEIHNAAIEGNWPAIEHLMGIAEKAQGTQTSRTTATLRSPEVLLSPHLSIETNATCAYQVFDAEDLAESDQILKNTEPNNITILLSDPSVRIWDLYKTRIDDPATGERRRYSEYFLDEIDGEIAKASLLGQSAIDLGWTARFVATAPGSENEALDSLGCSVGPSVGLFNPDIAGQNAGLLKDFASRSRETYSGRLTQLQERMIEAKNHTFINGKSDQRPNNAARSMTFSYALSKWSSALPEIQLFGPSIFGVTRGQLGLMWMAVENQDQEDLWMEAILGQIASADAMRFGDADPAGFRTLKSRLKYRLSSTKATLTK